MRAFTVDQPGACGSLQNLPLPTVAPHEILVRITVAGVNPIDWKRRDRINDGARLPLVLGQDFAGFVNQVGSNVKNFTPGDRIFGIAQTHGAYAEYTIVPSSDSPEPVAKTPVWLSDEQAAALPTAGLTALAALAALDLKRDDTLLVLGATGGVGGFATEIAHARGVHVVGTARTGKEGIARSRGAEQVIAYDRADIAASVRTSHPDGVDAVLDLVGDRETMKENISLLRPRGKIVSTIGSADQAWFAERDVNATNVVLMQTPQASPQCLMELASMVECGALHVPFVERPLAQAAAVLEESKSGHVAGKIVLKV